MGYIIGVCVCVCVKESVCVCLNVCIEWCVGFDVAVYCSLYKVQWAPNGMDKLLNLFEHPR